MLNKDSRLLVQKAICGLWAAMKRSEQKNTFRAQLTIIVEKEFRAQLTIIVEKEFRPILKNHLKFCKEFHFYSNFSAELFWTFENLISKMSLKNSKIELYSSETKRLK